MISALSEIDQISADRNSKFSDYKDQMSEPWWSHHLVRKLVLFMFKC